MSVGRVSEARGKETKGYSIVKDGIRESVD